MKSKRSRVIVGVVATVVIAATGFRIASHLEQLQSTAIAQQPNAEYEVPSTERFQPRVVIPKRFPTITEFEVKPGNEADAELNPTELVLGVSYQGETRAYPINMLTGPRREIINDRLGGSAIAATW